MKKPVLVGVLIFFALVAVMVYSTMTLAQHRVQVCMSYKGRENCRTAAGTTVEFATRTAISNACADISSGVTETMGCQQTAPTKLVTLK
jgi:hypothetical protein